MKVSEKIIASFIITTASHAGDRGSIPGRDRPVSITGSDNSKAKRSTTFVSVTGFPGDYHYKGLVRVTVRVAR